MKNLGQLMKQAQQMQAQDGRDAGPARSRRDDRDAGGGMVQLTLNGKGDVKRVKIDKAGGRPRRGRGAGGPDRRRIQRRPRQGRTPMPKARCGKLTGGLQLPRRLQAAVLGRAALSELDTLIQLLARLPGLGPRSARRAALHLIKRREALMEPLAAALPAAAAAIRPCRLRQSRHRRSLRDLPRPAARCGGDLRRRGSRRSVGVGAHRRLPRPLPCARRHVVGARRRRAGGTQHRAR